MGKILIVANVAKEHIIKFHIPTIKAFKDNGYQVDVACSGDEEVPYCDNQFHTCWKRSPFTFKTIKGIKELKGIIDNGNYDIVFCHTPVGGLVARMAAKSARKKGTKVVYCAHGLHFFKGAPKINWLIYYPIEKYLARYTDVFFAVNQQDYELVKEKFNKKMKVELVPEVGVNFDRLKIEDKALARKEYRELLNIKDGTTALIYVAELLPNKNQTMLIDTLCLLKEQNEDVCLILPGPDYTDGGYRKYAEEKGVADSVTFLGWRNDIGELMSACDICTASSIREGFGINLVEAMYCGLPVVATGNRGHVTVITDGENGFLVDVNDYVSMAQRVKELIHNDELRKKMSNLDVSKYDCNLIAQELYSRLTE